MKNKVRIVLFLTLFIGLGYREGSAQAVDLEKMAVEKLHKLIDEDMAGNAKLKDSEIHVGQKRIRVSAAVEHEQTQDEAYIFAARFDTTLTGADDVVFTLGSIGIGKDKKDAMETSVDEWVSQFGKALSRMLSTSDPKSKDEMGIFPGFLGVRGKLPSKGWLDGTWEMQRKLAMVVIPIVRKMKGDLFAVDLMIVVEKEGHVRGECRLNNAVSQELMDEMKKLDWKSNTSFLLKQFYLIRKNEPIKPVEKNKQVTPIGP
jgi:hypothetical protein